MSGGTQPASDIGLDSKVEPDKFWSRVRALGIDVWSHNGIEEFTQITLGISDEVALRLELIPVDNCDISFGFEFRQTGEARLPSVEIQEPEYTFDELEMLAETKAPMSIEHARSWQQSIDQARADSESGYVRVNLWGNRIFRELATQLGLNYKANSFPELYDFLGIVIAANEVVGIHIARFEEGQRLSAKIVDLTRPVWEEDDDE